MWLSDSEKFRYLWLQIDYGYQILTISTCWWQMHYDVTWLSLWCYMTFINFHISSYGCASIIEYEQHLQLSGNSWLGTLPYALPLSSLHGHLILANLCVIASIMHPSLGSGSILHYLVNWFWQILASRVRNMLVSSNLGSRYVSCRRVYSALYLRFSWSHYNMVIWHWIKIHRVLPRGAGDIIIARSCDRSQRQLWMS